MDRINISNLFPAAVDNNSISNKPLDIHSIINSTKSNKANILVPVIKKSNFNLNKIINKKSNRQKLAVLEYKKIFNLVLNKITIADDTNNTSIIYEVTDAIFSCPEYKSLECLNYIENRLRKMYMDTFKISEKSIFICWKNIEENKKQADIEMANS